MVHQAQHSGLITRMADHFIDKRSCNFVVCRARNLKLPLYLLEMMSGLKYNFQKSEVLMALDDGEKLDQFAILFNS